MSEPAHYYGGPLDDRTVSREGPYWPIFRGDDGRPISNAEGDAEYNRIGKEGARRYYMHQHRGGRHFYVHLTVWPGWYQRGQ